MKDNPMASRIPSSEQIRKQQKAEAEKETAAIKASLPTATNGGTAVGVLDSRTTIQKYVDEIAPASIGRPHGEVFKGREICR